MRRSLGDDELLRYVATQLERRFPDPDPVTPEALAPALAPALERAEHCFAHVANPYFHDGREPVFDHLHSEQYLCFLYLLANQLARDGGDPRLASKLYLLNKDLHAIDLWYEVELPEVFYVNHGVGTVVGRADFGNYLYLSQGCTVGGNRGAYPKLGEGVALFAGASVIGACEIGDRCQIAAGTAVIDARIGPDRIVFGSRPDYGTRPARTSTLARLFRI